jgi:hypothetical protein
MRPNPRWIAAALMLLLAACSGDAGLLPEDCTDDESYRTECSDCGPTDACIDPQPVCAPLCEGDLTPCDEQGGLCLDGACLHNVCG